MWDTFGHSCAVCNRLWWEKDFKRASDDKKELLKGIVRVSLASFVILNYTKFTYIEHLHHFIFK